MAIRPRCWIPFLVAFFASGCASEPARPASPETVYRAGSVSKLFTATAAMQLAERGNWA